MHVLTKHKNGVLSKTFYYILLDNAQFVKIVVEDKPNKWLVNQLKLLQKNITLNYELKTTKSPEIKIWGLLNLKLAHAEANQM